MFGKDKRNKKHIISIEKKLPLQQEPAAARGCLTNVSVISFFIGLRQKRKENGYKPKTF